jgi:hypothetical protein
MRSVEALRRCHLRRGLSITWARETFLVLFLLFRKKHAINVPGQVKRFDAQKEKDRRHE